MDIGFDGYVVLKAISMVENGLEQPLMPLLHKNNAYDNMEFDFEDSYNRNLWNIYYEIPTEQIEEIIISFIQNKIIRRKTIIVGGNCRSILYITSRGKKILHLLDRKYYPIIEKGTSMFRDCSVIIKERSRVIYSFKGDVV